MTPGSVHVESWRSLLEDLPGVPPSQAFGLSAGDALVVAVAHPDDETVAMGATLARLARDGVRVHVLAMSHGEAALDHVGAHVEGLADRRRRELTEATSTLGVTTATALDLPDGRLAEHQSRIETVVAEAVEHRRARAVLTLWRHDPHPDHQAVSRAVSAARAVGAGVHELGLWATHWTDPATVADDVVVPLLTDEESQRTKREALACYSSQTEPLAPGLDPVLPRSVLDWPYEYLVRA